MLDFDIQFSFVIISMNFRLKGLKYRSEVPIHYDPVNAIYWDQQHSNT